MNENQEVGVKCDNALRPPRSSATFTREKRWTYPFCRLEEILDELTTLKCGVPGDPICKSLQTSKVSSGLGLLDELTLISFFPRIQPRIGPL
jgi:hypothetical protein